MPGGKERRGKFLLPVNLEMTKNFKICCFLLFKTLKPTKRQQSSHFRKSFIKPPQERLKQLFIAVFYIIFAAFCVLTPQIVYAGTIPRTHFLTYGPGVSASARGNAFSATGDDMSVFYYNPSLLVNLTSSEITGGHWFLFDNAVYNFVGFSTKLNRSAFALAGTQLYRGEIEVREQIDDEPILTQNSQTAIYGSYALKLWKLKTNLGINLKYIYQNIYTQTNSCINLDAGFSKQLLLIGNPSGINLKVDTGLVMQNVLPSTSTYILTGSPAGNEVPQIIKLGIGFTITMSPRYNKKENLLTYDNLTFACDIIRRENQNDFAFGGQYRLINILFIRAGYNNGITAGVGIKYNDFQFDYAIVPGELSNFHKIGFTYRPEKPAVVLKQPTESEFKDEFQKVYKKARRIYDRYYRDALQLTEEKKYSEAAELLAKAIPLKPSENDDAKKLLAVCEQTISAIRTNVCVTNAQKCQNDGNLTMAYTEYLNAFNINPGDKGVLAAMDAICNQSSDTVKSDIYQLKANYIQTTMDEINRNLTNKEFITAEKNLQLIILLTPISDEIKTLTDKITDKKDLEIFNLTKSGVQSAINNQFADADRYFYEAAKLSPSDSGINEQREMAKANYLKTRKFSLADKLYADKLYYLAAITFATGEDPSELLKELQNFNPVYDFIPLLEDSVKDIKQ